MDGKWLAGVTEGSAGPCRGVKGQGAYRLLIGRRHKDATEVCGASADRSRMIPSCPVLLGLVLLQLL